MKTSIHKHIYILLCAAICICMACNRINGDEPSNPSGNNPTPDAPGNNTATDSIQNVETQPTYVEVNDSIKGEMRTYIANEKTSTGWQSNNQTAIIFAQNNKVHIIGLLGEYYENSDYRTKWVGGETLSENNDIIEVPNYTLLSYNSYSVNYFTEGIYMCLVKYHTDRIFEETDPATPIYFKIGADGTVKFDASVYPALPDGMTYKLAKLWKYPESSRNFYTIYDEYVMQPTTFFPPANMKWQELQMSCKICDDYKDYPYYNYYKAATIPVKVAIDGKQVYFIIDNCCFHGTIQGNEIVFEDGQDFGLRFKIIYPTIKNDEHRWLVVVDGYDQHGGDFKIMPVYEPLKFSYSPETQNIGKANHDIEIGSAINQAVYLDMDFNDSKLEQ